MSDQTNGDSNESEPSAAAEDEAALSREASAPEEEFEGSKELAAATAYMRRTKFGEVSRRLLPFSRQLRDEIRSTFPIDADVFDVVDENYLGVRLRTWLAFIVTTGVLTLILAVYAWLVGAMWVAPISEALSDVVPFAGAASALGEGAISRVVNFLGASIVLFALGVAVRQMSRYFLFTRIENQSEKLGNTITSKYDDIVARVHHVCSKALKARIAGGDWPRRAHDWTLIAQWNTKRAEYIDRYFTTIAWKLELFFERIELFFIAVRVLLIVGAFALLLRFGVDRIGWDQVGQLWPLIPAFLIFQAYFWIGWVWLNRQPNDIWRKISAMQVQKSEQAKEHQFEEVAELVETLVHNVISVESRKY